MYRRHSLILVSKDKILVKKFSSKWLQNIIKRQVIKDDEFFEFVMFLSGDMKEFANLLHEKFKEYGKENENKKNSSKSN